MASTGAALAPLQGVAHAILPPSAPGAPTVTIAPADGASRPDAQLAWAPATDTDGAVAGYVVEWAEGAVGAFMALPPQGPTTTALVPDLRAGRTHRFRVVAVDDAGDRSPPSAETAVALDRLTVVPVLALRRPGSVRACLRVCVVESLTGSSLRVSTDRAALMAGRRVQLELQHRVPGRRRLAPAGRADLTFDVAGQVSLPAALTRLPRSPGLWCAVAVFAGDDELAPARSTRACVRFRPPVTIGWAGDIVVGSEWGLPPAGGRYLFSRVRHLLRAPDLMIGNYEGTLSRGGTRRCSGGPLCFIFQAPPGRARTLRQAGFDVMNLANNHGLDMGLGARAQTVRALNRVGIEEAGLPGRVTVMQVADTRVAVIGVSAYVGSTRMSPGEVRALVRNARRRGDVVVMAMHVGTEGSRGVHVPRGADNGANTRAATHAAIDAGADMVVGSGPHVVRGVERYRGRYIVYSSGNFAGWHNFALGGLSSQSGVVTSTVTYRGVPIRNRWHGVRIVAPGIPTPERGSSVVRRVAALSRADFGRRAARFRRGGWFR